MSGLFFPVWLLLTWLTDMTVHGCGPTHVETTAEKMGTTIVLTLVFAVLLALRVRHSRRQSAALRMLRVGLEEPNVELGGEREDARVRVDSSTIASDSAEAAEEAVASDSAIELEVGGLDAATTGTDRSVRGRDRRR